MKERSLRTLDSNPCRLSNSPRYARRDFDRATLEVCRGLLGQRLVKLESDGTRLSGLIVEAEAYIGREDKGCHASAGLTPRNGTMWGPPGHAYVYFTYGMHWMLNLVTEGAGRPAAVLLRTVLPVEGVSMMRKRRTAWRKSRGVRGPAPWENETKRAASSPAQFTDGPAKICQALSIDRTWDGHDLCNPDSRLFVEKRPALMGVTTGPRVGLNSVPEPWKSIPWRFRVDRGLYTELVAEEGLA